MLAMLGACEPYDPPGGPGLPGAPAAPSAGLATGNLIQAQLDGDGGTLTLAGDGGGSLTVSIPPDAVAEPTTFTLEEVAPNTALGAVGSAYRIGPAAVDLQRPLGLAFTPPSGNTLGEVTAAYQDTLGYWFRVYAVERDEVEGEVRLASSRVGDWSLVAVATQRDLHGDLELTSSLDQPFTVRGSVVLQFIGEYPSRLVFVPTGTLELQGPVTIGTATCSVDPPNPYSVHPSVVELVTATPQDFYWGINGQWHLSCDDGTQPFVATSFDTYGITNLGCLRSWEPTPLFDPTHVRGRYTIDCGAGRTASGAWDLVEPGQTPGPLP